MNDSPTPPKRPDAAARRGLVVTLVVLGFSPVLGSRAMVEEKDSLHTHSGRPGGRAGSTLRRLATVTVNLS